jgi:hypothetical protein
LETDKATVSVQSEAPVTPVLVAKSENVEQVENKKDAAVIVPVKSDIVEGLAAKSEAVSPSSVKSEDASAVTGVTAKSDNEKVEKVETASAAKSETEGSLLTAKSEEKATTVASSASVKSEGVESAKAEVTPGCPDSKTGAKIAPCVCHSNGSPKGTVVIDCTNSKSTNAHIETVLDHFLTTPGLGPVGAVALGGSQLTSIPTQIAKFDKLSMVSLLDNNIKIIPTGAFNFSSSQNSQFMISLKGNQLASIEPGAFDGKFGEGSMLSLASNQLTRFESATFEKILQQLAAFATKSRLVVQNSKYIIAEAFILNTVHEFFIFSRLSQ